ncbi:CPBP family intramembrane glutamic endopeptidase [Rickettsia endosymbiont of Halotydeus destructor]|uniref:CPBP family intramembrane glutamic endopeptidase n=1 Tax=Rickettsia endosymbiont of Halotydeus destructor TaxID=2996754 RepID=UPI003BAFE6EC
MQNINTTYTLLLIAIITSLFVKNKKPSYILLIITNLFALYQGVINIVGFFSLVLFAGIIYSYFNFQNLNKIAKILLFLIISICVAAFALHKVPGFFNILAIHQIQLSELSPPFSMYLNFDKVMAALIIYCVSDLYILEKNSKSAYIKYTITSLLLCIIVILTPSFISGYILFDPKLPDILPIWTINNFFFVCMSEEIIFRGFMQRTLQDILKKQQILAIIITSLVFGFAHFQGGLIYMALSSICGFFYGYAYYKTGKILCSMVVHFGLNLFHLLLFTYPTAIKIL